MRNGLTGDTVTKKRSLTVWDVAMDMPTGNYMEKYMKPTYLAVALAVVMTPSLVGAATQAVKLPAMPAPGIYDEKRSDSSLQACNTTISNGIPVTILGTAIPTFNLVIVDDNNDEEDDSANALCIPRVTVKHVKGSDDDAVKQILSKALCSQTGDDGLEALFEVSFTKNSVTYGGSYIEVVNNAGTSIVEPYKSTFKQPKAGSCL